MLVLLAHTLKNKFEIPTLEIGEVQRLPEVNINRQYVRVEDATMPPVVLLLGCETAVLDIQFENFATQFRINGAAIIVLNDAAPVLGRHVVPVAKLLVEELGRVLRPAGDVRYAVSGRPPPRPGPGRARPWSCRSSRTAMRIGGLGGSAPLTRHQRAA